MNSSPTPPITEAPAPQGLLTAEQVAASWQVSRAHVYGLARSGRIPTVAIGRYYRFRLDALIEWERAGGTRVYSGRDRRV
jgi:excisionase family DNA binding protein